MRLLVTGGAGFIGANFVHHWLRQHPGDRLVALDALNYAGDRSNLPQSTSSNFEFVQGNICDAGLIERILRDEHIDTIVHCAAETHVNNPTSRPDSVLETNVTGTQCLLRCAQKAWLMEHPVERHHFHHVSTNTALQCLDQTAASKAAADCFVQAFHHEYGLVTTTSNCSDTYGPFQYPEKFVPQMIVRALLGRPMLVHRNGSNVNWMHVSDLCHALERILSAGTPGKAYFVGGESECPIDEVVRQLCIAINECFDENPALRQKFPKCPAAWGGDTSSLVHFTSGQQDQVSYHALDRSRIQLAPGYRARVTLEKGLRDTIDWYVDNHWWWTWTLQDGHVFGSDPKSFPPEGLHPTRHSLARG